MHHLVEVVADRDPDLLGDRFWILGAVGVEVRDGTVIGAFDDAGLAAAAATALGGRASAVADTTGLDAWRDHAVVTDVGPFSIRPPWLEPGEGVDLVIDPGHAFGSGSHPSTRLALTLIADLVTPGMRVADLGAGSGVLAVAAARLGAEVLAVDLDPAARDAIDANARRNGVRERIETVIGDVATTVITADLSVLNVTIDIHEHLGPALHSLPPGPLVVAGILAGDQEQRCAAAHHRHPRTRVADGEWAALVLDHGADRPSS